MFLDNYGNDILKGQKGCKLNSNHAWPFKGRMGWKKLEGGKCEERC